MGLVDDRLSQAEVDAIRAYHFGNVSFVSTTSVGVDGIRAVTDAVQAQVSAGATAGVRFFVAANQEGGQIQALRGAGFTRMPTAVEQGAMDPSELETEATRWGRELAAAGVNMDFAPVMDVVPAGTEQDNQPIGVLEREYGHDPATVASHGVAFLRGMDRAGIAATAKHFPGLGRVIGNTDFTADVVDEVTTLDDPYLRSFQQAVDAGVPFVMVALATYTRIDPGRLAVFSPIVIQQMLRGALGFDGVIVSDELGAAVAVADIDPATRAVDFLLAGGDMIVSKTLDFTVPMFAGVASRATSDPSFRGLVDGAVLRVLQAKEAAGLLPCG
jgi:beta-N-acetylhexosaminidase